MTHSYATWLVHMWHEPFMYDTTHSRATWLIHMWHDSFMYDTTHSRATWLIHVWHDSLVCHRLIHVRHDPFMCEMTHWCVTDSFIPYMYPYCVNQKQRKSIVVLHVYSVLKHTTACLLASIFLRLCEKQRMMHPSIRVFFKNRHPQKQSSHSAFFFLWWLFFFGRRIWVELIWASLKETCIAVHCMSPALHCSALHVSCSALHLVCALYAI